MYEVQQTVDEHTMLMAKESHIYNSNQETIIPGNVASTGSPTIERRESLENNNITMNYIKYLKLRIYLMEPMILLLVFGYMLSSTVLKNCILYQTCSVILHFNTTVCNSLEEKNNPNNSNTTDITGSIEELVQSNASHIFMVLDVVQAIMPALFGVFVGVWADRFGRKPLLVIAFTGYGLSYVLMAVITQMTSIYEVSPWYYIITVVPTAVTGGAVTYSVAAVCYISDVATPASKSYRMILYEVAMWTGLLLGSFCSGYLYERVGATFVFYTSAAIILVAAFIIAVFMPESLNLNRPQLLKCTQPLSGITTTTTDRRLCDLTMVKLTWQTAFKQRAFNDRVISWMALSVILITAFISDGSSSVIYMFLRRQLKWALRQYTTYDAIHMLMLISGNLFGIWLLRKSFRLSLITVAIFAFFSQMSSCVMKAFVFTDWQLYVATGLGMFKAISNPMCRTVLTNLLPADELGKVLSLLGTLQSLMSLVSSPTYIFVYSITLTTFAGFFNLLSAHLCIVALVLLFSISRKAKINVTHYEAILN